jgi:hypothetical protein
VHDAKARQVVDEQVKVPIVAMLTPTMEGFEKRIKHRLCPHGRGFEKPLHHVSGAFGLNLNPALVAQ